MIRSAHLGTLSGAAVRLANLTTGNSNQFRSGDQFRVEIFGAQPGARIVNSVSQTDAAGQIHASASELGQADANGYWHIDGSMSDYEIGSWVEQWTAGGVEAGTLKFSVIAKSTPQPATTGSGSTPTTPTTTGSNNAGNTTHTAAAASTIPSMALYVALALGAAWLLFGGNR